MRHAPWWALALIVLVGFTPTHASTQSAYVRAQLNERAYKEVLPAASTFESEGGLYKHIRGYNGENELVGFAFLTQDLGARSRGYNGVIPILVGLDVRGRITGVKVLRNFEPYGYRSINRPEYGAQFVGKTVLDPLEVGEDIDGYSGATITTVGATKSIRHASRRLAREFLVKK